MGIRPSSYVLTQPGPMRLYGTAEIVRMPPPTWLIDQIMPSEGLIGLYGPPGHGKSFLALDFALCVSTGRPWNGLAVARGSVLYVCAEGGTGIGKRVQSWLTHNNVAPKDADVAWLTEALPMIAESDQMELLMNRINDEVQSHPSLVVLDTLARCFEGDENAQSDMGHFIQGVDYLRKELGSAVIVVHHTRLEGDRERGSSAFRGAADTMISVMKKKETIYVGNNKQKDSEEFETLKFGLLPVEQTASCVIVPQQTIVTPADPVLDKVMNSRWLSSDHARAEALAQKTGKSKEACRSQIRRYKEENQ